MADAGEDEERRKMDTASFAALDEAVNADADAPAVSADGAPAAPAADQDGGAEEAEPEAPKKKGPGIVFRSIRWFLRWHPVLFLAVAAALAVTAWRVYPEPEARKIPPAEYFYRDGLDRLYRVLNPDLPLLAGSPADEALAARNAFLNLFVFYRETLGSYPEFINPHLLLAEANRILAESSSAMAEQYWRDAVAAYNDAALWENRADTPERTAIYYDNNFLGGAAERAGNVMDAIDPDNDEVVLRRERRRDYIDYHGAEGQVNLGRPETARTFLEGLRGREDGRRREALRLSAREDAPDSDVPRRVFELGPDDYRDLDLLLARAYDGLGQLPEARGWYLRYLASTPGGRSHAFVVERLADIAMGDGEVYRRADPEQAAADYAEAVRYYQDLLGSPSATAYQRDNATLGLARANSRLAGLVEAGGMAGVDELSALGRTLRGWLETFSGQPLPRRTLGLPEAVGGALASPEMLLPGVFSLPGAVGGSLSAMAGGRMTTPHGRRRVYLTEALDNYDRIASAHAGTPLGDRAMVMAARESWNLGNKADTEARLERMLDPLSSPEVILAARLGLAVAALDRNELRRAHMLILGGMAHPMPLWFTPEDADWRKIAVTLGTRRNGGGEGGGADAGAWRRVWDTLSDEGREIAGYAASGRRLDDEYVGRFLRALNTMLRRGDFYAAEDFPAQDRGGPLRYVLARDPELLTPEEIVWRNRLLLEEAWPYDLARRAGRDVISFDPFPTAREIQPDALIDPESVRDALTRLAAAWSAAASGNENLPDRYRMLRESNTAYTAALDSYQAEPGETLYELAGNYESLADIRERQGRHIDALSLTATAARSFMDVSLRAERSPREMDALLAAGDAFFRSGLLERTVESMTRFLDRFGHNAQPGTDGAMTVVTAENLLGRAYWFLSSASDALESFRRNIPRRTPDRFKSMYYIGRVLLEEGGALNNPELLGGDAKPLPDLDRNGDPVIDTALQAFNFVRQSPDINPTARAWRWSTFDLAKLRHLFAERARQEWEAIPDRTEEQEKTRPWLQLYDTARVHLTEALERYPLRRNSSNAGAAPMPGLAAAAALSVQVEPEDYADTMAARFEAEYLLADTLLVLAENRGEEDLHALARAHLENLRDRSRYAGALFDRTLDRFQLNAAVIREEIEGGSWDKSLPLPRTRLGDDEGPTHSPERQTEMLRNSMMLLGEEYFRAGEQARERQLLASASAAPGQAVADNAAGFYQDAYRTWQDFYDRFGLADGPQAMVKMGDSLNRLGFAADAGNHYRMAVNMAAQLPADTRADGLLDIGPAFWGDIAAQRVQDMADGYTVP